MTVAKDYRLTIRMSPEMGAWIDEQSGLRELDAAAYVRMLLAQIKNGQADAPFVVHVPDPRPLPGLPPASEPDKDMVPTSEPDENFIPEGAYLDEPAEPPPVDVNAIVYQTLAEADVKGLTRQRPQDEYEEDDDHPRGMPRTVTPRGNWQEGGFRKTKDWAGRA